MSLVLGTTIIIVTGLMMAQLDMLLGMTWTPWRTHLVQEKIGWHWSILETRAMSSHTKRTTGQLRIYQWQLVQPWSREKTGWTYCSSDMKFYTSGTSSTVPSSTRTRSKTILDILEDMYKQLHKRRRGFWYQD